MLAQCPKGKLATFCLNKTNIALLGCISYHDHNMKMDKERFIKTGLLEQYVLGLTDEEESYEVERHAEAYPEIQDEMDKLRESMKHYALQYALLPAAELRARAKEQTGETPKRQPGRSAAASPRPSRLLLPASLALLALASFLALSFYQGKVASDQQYQQLSSEYHALKEDCGRQQAEHTRLQELYAFLADKQTLPIQLPGNQLLPAATATVFWNETHRRAYVNPAGLPPPPAGKTYQIWADVHGEMVNMGLINAHKPELHEVAFINAAESLNITIEPEGGSAEPTVALLIASSNL